MFLIAKMKNKTFHSEDSGFTICKCQVVEQSDDIDLTDLDDAMASGSITISGYFPIPKRNTKYKFIGELKRHPKFGMQFNANKVEEQEDNSKEALIAYLSGDNFEGVGEKTAEKIIDKLGLDAVKKITEDYTCLIGVAKINERKAQAIRRTIINSEDNHDKMKFLTEYGFNPKLSMRIIKFYNADIKNILATDPYQIYDDIPNVPFIEIDEIILRNGFEGNNNSRLKRVIVFIMKRVTFQKGNTYLTEEQLIYSIKRFLKNDFNESVIDVIEELIENEILTRDKNGIFETRFYEQEKAISEILFKIYSRKSNKSVSKTIVERLEETLEIEYAEKQKEAIINCLKYNISVLTGGPGTGKTTTVKGIIEAIIDSGTKREYIKLLSPTGKASKRLTEQTSMPASTIHKYLGYEGDDKFKHDEENKVFAKVIIIDEFSMVDTNLFHQLLISLNENVKIILIGDSDQLPSVSQGQILSDIITSKVIKVVKLDKIHRQSENSEIIKLAHSIKDDAFDHTVFEKKKDARYYNINADEIEKSIKVIISSALNKGQSLDDIQILAPMYKGPVGIDSINNIIQNNFNPKSYDKNEIKFFNKVFRVNDRVIQLKNKENGIMNGDVGVIVSIEYKNSKGLKADKIIVDFDNRLIEYTKNELQELNLAYCISIHKSQGSEYKTIIMPVFKSYSIMLQKNIIYTGITRAKNFLLVLGDLNSFKSACDNTIVERQTSLKTNLLDDFGQTENVEPQKETKVKKNKKINDKEIPFDELGEEMEDISPYDFM